MRLESAWRWVWPILALATGFGCGEKDHPPLIGDGAGPNTSGRGGNTGSGDGGNDSTTEAGSGGESTPAEGGGGTGVRPGKSRVLTKLIDEGPWMVAQETTGIAADDKGRLFLNDENAIYVVENGEVALFLTLEDGVSAVNRPTNALFKDFDIGPDQKLYITFGDWILRADTATAHQAEVWRELDPEINGTWARFLGVLAEDSVVVSGSPGLSLIGNQNELVYTTDDFDFDTGCATEDMAVGRSGVFLYQPGCNGSPLGRGNIDGSGVATVYESTLGLIGGERYPVSTFGCSGRREGGGFYTVLEGGLLEAESTRNRLFYFTEEANQDGGFSEILTDPPLAKASYLEQQAGVILSFHFCAIAAAPDDTIYIQTGRQLWKVSP